MPSDIELNKRIPRDQEELLRRPLHREGVKGSSPRMVKQRFLNRLMLVCLIVAVGMGGYFYYKLHRLEKGSIQNPEAQDLLGKVAKLYLIPIGEDPTIATVSDPTKLKDQAFFANAQKDDKVLIFTKAGKAVLYRPSIDKIIEIAPINNEQPTPPPEKSSGPLKDKTF